MSLTPDTLFWQIGLSDWVPRERGTIRNRDDCYYRAAWGLVCVCQRFCFYIWLCFYFHEHFSLFLKKSFDKAAYLKIWFLHGGGGMVNIMVTDSYIPHLFKKQKGEKDRFQQRHVEQRLCILQYVKEIGKVIKAHSVPVVLSGDPFSFLLKRATQQPSTEVPQESWALARHGTLMGSRWWA